MLIKPRKALNKAFLKIRPNRIGIELFKSKLILLLDSSKANESEEFHKNLISDFLKNTYYSPNYFINTKGRYDLVIHTSSEAKSNVGVIIEAKSPTNKAEMISEKSLNNKALQELVLYFLRERITHKNLEVKHLVATNLNEWFLFDAQIFDKLFAQNKSFVKQFQDFEEGKLSGNTTDFFYREIAKPFIASVIDKIEYTYFDLATYDTTLRNADKEDDAKLIVLYKLLSPEHLLKLSFANDSNSLDKNFYNELLHLIGLTETKEGGKKLIQRPKVGERNSGSLLENAINQLDSLDKISRLPNPKQYGATHEERLFTVGLELCITWVNRILFLKLLEAQLISYHKGDRSYAFLHKEVLHDYDNLNALFFMVLAKKPEDRNARVKDVFAKVPYLNSSLFEPTDLEHDTLFIAGLEDTIPLPFITGTVIKDESGKKQKGALNALDYFFDFLDAYDFASEGSEEIQEDNKTLINASVLGLIFEKINGYKDGSFYTPSFITMYMCKETIRRAVVQKFKSSPNPSKAGENFSTVETFNDLYNSITDLQGANEIINSLKICDPAVGSGHFLVSALNEIISIKQDLGILLDRKGKRLKEYQMDIVNDELIITDDDGIPFTYNPKSAESQRVQETLFHEKQTIIENCLFGVDINPNSVKICRLRLWIELLKNAYYKVDPRRVDNPSRVEELETLPNIDINIKCGNSLIARFGLDADLKKALKQSKWNIESYKLAVETYRNAESKEQKREMERLILAIKQNFSTEIRLNDPIKTRLEKLSNELYNRFTGAFLFEPETPYGKIEKDLEKKRKIEKDKLEKEIKKLLGHIEEIKNNTIYENAFEWRFEFPEVLNDAGDFVGFDVVIGNPPYVDIKELEQIDTTFFFDNYTTASNRINLYAIFIEKSYRLLRSGASLSFIIPNSILMNSSYSDLRKLIVEDIDEIIKLPDNVFEEATVETIIFSLMKDSHMNNCNVIKYGLKEKISVIDSEKRFKLSKDSWKSFEDLKFNVYLDDSIFNILNKLNCFKKLSDFADFTLGITPYDKYKGHSQQLIKNREFHSKEILSTEYKPLIKGENIVPFIVKETISEYIKYGNWLGAARDEKFFTMPRIIVRQIISGNPPKIYAGYTDKPLYFTQIGFSIIPSDEIEVKFLLCLLNSKIINYYHKYMFLDIEKELFQKILIENCKNLPIANISSDLQQPFIEKVDQILTLKQADASADTSVLEREIDLMVYELYGLSAEEIGVVEGN